MLGMSWTKNPHLLLRLTQYLNGRKTLCRTPSFYSHNNRSRAFWRDNHIYVQGYTTSNGIFVFHEIHKTDEIGNLFPEQYHRFFKGVLLSLSLFWNKRSRWIGSRLQISPLNLQKQISVGNPVLNMSKIKERSRVLIIEVCPCFLRYFLLRIISDFRIVSILLESTLGWHFLNSWREIKFDCFRVNRQESLSGNN